MKQLRIIGLLFLTVLLFTVGCKRLYEMRVTAVPTDQTGPFVNPETDRAALVVSAEIAGLQFKTDHGKIHSFQEPEPGQYWLFLEPGNHNITISRSQFKDATQKVTIAATEVREMRVATKAPPKVRGDLMVNRTELRLLYNPATSDKTIVGGIKGTPSKLDFSKGYVSLHPLVGDRDMLVRVDEKQWAKTVPLKSGEKSTERIEFGEGIVVAAKGGLNITTEPAGALVYLDGLVQEQVTPLAMSGLVAGSHEVEVVLDEYQPQMKVVQVTSGAPTEAHFSLKIALSRLQISSEPLGAELILDGEKKGVTPVDLSKLEPGKHTVELSAPLYHPLRQDIVLRGGKLFTRNLKLQPNFGGLAISSEPSGVEVFLDDESLGTTPLEKAQILSGEHALRISLEHYQTIRETVTITDGGKLEKSYALEPNYGLVTIISTPPSADVIWVETDQTLGKTPLEKAQLPPGKHTLRVIKPQYDPYDIAVDISVGEEQSFAVTLTHMTGRLSVASTPPLANIFLDGEDYGQTPRLIENLPTGEYEIRLIKQNYEVLVGRIII
ncbi:MAG: PEGA domain-containing protein, partial [Calditrichota bacterium]